MKTMTIGWKELTKHQQLQVEPEGYSTSETIAKKLHVCTTQARNIMRTLRLDGKVKAMRARNKNGQVVWFYKD